MNLGSTLQKNGAAEKKTMDYYCSELGCHFHVEVCPCCDDGYLVRRRGRNGGYFFGRSNFPSSKQIKREFQRKRYYGQYVS